jgi:beta-lactamase class D
MTEAVQPVATFKVYNSLLTLEELVLLCINGTGMVCSI